MIRAIWNGAVIAEAEHTVILEGNHYFPPGSLRNDYFRASHTHTVCGWKGQADYFTILVDGAENPDVAWVYRDPKPDAAFIAGMVAFWKGVRIESGPSSVKPGGTHD
ncbi:MAG: DUF427 domain-containing protein [Rhodospirillales bacterium]|nr:MAG: DUF427 domain-containing protein [Rhodospirillales bacterium]